MNTTPYFDEISQSVPMERLMTLRIFALLRLCCVGLAAYVCILQLFQIGFWSGTTDRAIIFFGILVGIGLYSDGVDIVWRKLGPLGQLTALGLLFLGGVMSVLFSGGVLMSSISFALLVFLLSIEAYTLITIAGDPLRTARYRQVQRFLRTLPRSERRAKKGRLEREFQTLLAEGFH